MTAPEPNPPTYTAGLGEFIRAHRLYTGLVARGMARYLQLDRRDYQRIENGQDDCPPGLLDKLAVLVNKFDDDVAALISAAEREAADRGERTLTVTVSTDPREEWERCVTSKAAILLTDHDPLASDPAVQIVPVVT